MIVGLIILGVYLLRDGRREWENISPVMRIILPVRSGVSLGGTKLGWCHLVADDLGELYSGRVRKLMENEVQTRQSS